MTKLRNYRNSNALADFILSVVDDPNAYGLVFNSFVDYDQFMMVVTLTYFDIEEYDYFYLWRRTIRKRFGRYPINVVFYPWLRDVMEYRDPEATQVMAELIVDFAIDLKRKD